MALALQLALTLGHSHAGELYGHDHVAAHAPYEPQPDEAFPAAHPHAPGDFRPDGFVRPQVATGLTATPPVLAAPRTPSAPLTIRRTLSDTPARARGGFHPRGPPQS